MSLLNLPRTDNSEHTRKAVMLTGSYEALTHRKISEETCRIYGYQVGQYKGLNVQIANYLNKEGVTVGQHIRMPNKEFTCIGNVKSEHVQLFGQHLGSGGRGTRLIITEGQIDAMSVFEFLKTHPLPKEPKTCVVSVTGGCGGALKSITAHLEWISEFEDVILWFDEDDPGRKAARECAERIGPKARVVSGSPEKDASDLWVNQRADAMRRAIIGAARRRPAGIRPAAELLSTILDPDQRRGLSFPWSGWNRLTNGMLPGELWLLTGGTNLGKSFFTRYIGFHLAQQGVKVANIGLEESNSVTVDRLVSIALSTKFHDLDGDQRRAFVKTIGNDAFESAIAPIRDNIFVLDKFGSEDFDKFVSAVKFYVLGEGCQVVILDHFSILADGIALNVDQRRAIDKCIKELKELCVSLNFTMLVVSHLSRTEGKPHEEGGRPTLRDLRGSHSLAQIPDYVIALQRNPHSEDFSERNLTYCHLLKNRPIGKVGQMNKVAYLEEEQSLIEIPEVSF